MRSGEVNGHSMGVSHSFSKMTVIKDRFLAPWSQTPKQLHCLFLYAFIPAPALEQLYEPVKVNVVLVKELRAMLPGIGNSTKYPVIIDGTDKLT